MSTVGNQISVQTHVIFSKPEKEVEHRTAFSLDHAELNMFETQKEAFDFMLRFQNPVVVSMISGKKIMHLKGQQPFDFFPGETIIMPAEELMKIDFPEASPEQPTRCLALDLAPEFIRETLDMLNEHFPKSEKWEEWAWCEDNFLLLNHPRLAGTLGRLIEHFSGKHYGKQFLAANTTRELIVQLLQTKAQHLLLEQTSEWCNRHRLAFVVDYIRKNLTGKINVEDLAEKACLSRAQFFRVFQREIGMSPIKFINEERIKLAKKLLRDPTVSITEACFHAGFNNLHYFSRLFKQMEHISPSEFRKRSLVHVKRSIMNK